MKILIFLLTLVAFSDACLPSLTVASGPKAPKDFCSGDLIFEDNFDFLDLKKWRHQSTMASGFQWYVNDSANSYTENGKLHMKPTLTADVYGEEFLRSGYVNINWRYCTAYYNNGCNKTGTPEKIINPIRSAGFDSAKTFAFKYGAIEFRAKTPRGDWLWPVLWLKPVEQKYGGWPRSGEIDVLESRGNQELYGTNKVPMGNQRVTNAIHFGMSHKVKKGLGFMKRQVPGFSEDFHKYKLLWTPEKLEFVIDDETIGTINAGEGFYKTGGFEKMGKPNIWVNGTLMAPFDEKFYILMNLSVGGNNYFGDGYVNTKKPWINNSPRAAADFWEGRNQWLPTWKLNTSDGADFQIDYVRVWAL